MRTRLLSLVLLAGLVLPCVTHAAREPGIPSSAPSHRHLEGDPIVKPLPASTGASDAPKSALSKAKGYIFAVLFLVTVPVVGWACSRWTWPQRLTVIVMIWSTCESSRLSLSFVSREFYRAMSRGFEVCSADLCAVALLLAMILRRKRVPLRLFVPLSLPFAFFFAVGVCSWMTAARSLDVSPLATYIPYDHFETRLYPWFELFKIVRAFLVYFVIVNYVRDESTLRTVLAGLVITAVYLTGVVLFDRYILGINRVRGTLGHPNSLATYMAMMATVSFCFALYARKWFEGLLYLIPVAMGGVCVVMAISRGGLLALGFGLANGLLFLMPRNFSVKNWVLVMIGVLGAMAILAKAANTLMARFVGEQDVKADMEYRGLYNAQAKLMAHDHFFGVGLGNFSAWSFEKYAAELDENFPPGTPPHNIWFLILGESGYIGVLSFFLIWARFYSLTFPLLLRGKNSLMLTGVIAGTCATLAGQVQNMLQLGFRQSPLYFLNHICLGMAVASWYSLRQSQAALSRKS